MYFVIYAIFYLVSLLPFPVLYLFSDVTFFLLYHVIGYRKKIVYANLEIAFPEKSPKEKKVVMRQFYKNLADTFLETIKLLSISGKEFDKHATCDIAAIDSLTEKGLQIQFHSGHQMNWEYAHLCFAKKVQVPWIGVYMKINSKPIDRLFLQIRRKYRSVMMAAHEFKTTIRNYYHKPYILALIADQSPGMMHNAQWLYFFSKPAPFLTVPEKSAIRNKTAVVFIGFKRISRGKYHFTTEIVTENASGMSNGELTRLYRDFLEKAIREQPDNYLWSHRRWKHSYDPSYVKRWIDTKNPPQ